MNWREKLKKCKLFIHMKVIKKPNSGTTRQLLLPLYKTSLFSKHQQFFTHNLPTRLRGKWPKQNWSAQIVLVYGHLQFCCISISFSQIKTTFCYQRLDAVFVILRDVHHLLLVCFHICSRQTFLSKYDYQKEPTLFIVLSKFEECDSFLIFHCECPSVIAMPNIVMFRNYVTCFRKMSTHI